MKCIIRVNGSEMKQEKLEAILGAAKKMFARYGLRKTSLDDLARMARVAKGTIYNYFGSKDRVYLEVLAREADETLDKIFSAVARQPSPERKLAAFVTSRFRHMRQAANMLNLDREGMQHRHPSKAARIRDDLFEREVDAISKILREGKERGTFRLDNPILAARAIAHALRGFELNWLVRESEERIEHYLEEFLRILLLGLLAGRGEENRRMSGGVSGAFTSQEIGHAG